MGTYVNPNYDSFRSDTHSSIYVDKTGLLSILNSAIGGVKRYFAVSRARRFGKSMAAGMIDAYYSKGCDSKELFTPYAISKDPGFGKYLNKYNVLHFDVATFFNAAKTPDDIIPMMDRRLLREMIEEFPFLKTLKPEDTAEAIDMVFKKDGIRFVVIIDEYDCIIRDDPENTELIKNYLKYLRGFFKTEESKKFLALGYITGILPIKKVDGESALNNFSEYTMTDPGELVGYFGFTQAEVERECRSHNRNIEDIRDWYDGYYMYSDAPENIAEAGNDNENGSVRIINSRYQKLYHIYNPNSVVDALMRGPLVSYWKNTGSFGSLRKFITLNYAGLKEDVVFMLSGGRRKVNINNFQNDLVQFKKKDDVLACLIHMGYLGYDAYTREAFIPNREVAEVFQSAIETGDWDDVSDALEKSEDLLNATIAMDERKVAEIISGSHQDYASIINFHDENALAVAIMISYYTARTDYRVIRELPTGRGFADIAFIPKREGEKPAMIVELKWNRSARAAIKQIRDKNYTGVLSGYKGDILLVGISYSKKSGKYSCRIEKTGL